MGYKLANNSNVRQESSAAFEINSRPGRKHIAVFTTRIDKHRHPAGFQAA